MMKNELGQPIGDPLEVTLPRPFPPHTAMEGRYCSVLPLTMDHAEGLFDAYQTSTGGRIWTYLPYGPFETVDALRDWMQSTCFSDDPQFYTITLPDGTPAGVATYLRIDPANGSVEVGHINFSPLLQRTPAATEAMYLMMARAFDLGYRRYEWKCDALNAGSMRAAKRLGFQYEGTFRQATHYKGRNRDTAWWSILNSEWPDIRAAFERWLSPDNFNQEGRQITPLKTR